MKTLTVRQPHAQLIALGVKTIETRTKPTKYRGPLLVHAAGVEAFSQGSIVGEWQLYRSDRQDRPMARRTRMHKTDSTISVILPLGAIVASCKLVDCVPILEGTVELALEEPRPCIVPHDGTELSLWRSNSPEGEEVDDQRPYGDFTPGRFAWLLEDIKPVEQRCPACWGEGVYGGRSAYRDMSDGEVVTGRKICLVCHAAKVCDPIPAKGKQGLWNWEPA